MILLLEDEEYFLTIMRVIQQKYEKKTKMKRIHNNEIYLFKIKKVFIICLFQILY